MSFRFLVFTSLLALVGFGGPACASAQERRNENAVRNEIKVGRGLAAKLAKRYGLVRNESVTKYVNLVGRGLAENSSRSELTFYFGILDSDDINAFSCPGGYILFTRGSLRAMNDEAELAFVLAHEIAHVAFKHSGDFDQDAGFVDFIAGLLGGGGGVVNAAIRQASSELEKTLLEGGRQRSLEFDADLAGLTLVSQMGYDPRAAVDYIQRMESAGGSQLRSRTHPPASARIRRIKDFIADQQLSGGRRNAGRFSRYRALLGNAGQ